MKNKIIGTLLIAISIFLLTACLPQYGVGRVFKPSTIEVKYEYCEQPTCLALPCPVNCTKLYVCEDGRYIWNTRLMGTVDSDLAEMVKNSEDQTNMLFRIGSWFEANAKEMDRTNWYYEYQGDFEPCGELSLSKNIELVNLSLNEYNQAQAVQNQ